MKVRRGIQPRESAYTGSDRFLPSSPSSFSFPPVGSRTFASTVFSLYIFLFPFHFTSSFFSLSLLLINTLSFSPVFHLLTFWQQEYLFFLLMFLKM